MKKLFLALALTGMVGAVSAGTLGTKGDDKTKKECTKDAKSCKKGDKACCKKKTDETKSEKPAEPKK